MSKVEWTDFSWKFIRLTKALNKTIQHWREVGWKNLHMRQSLCSHAYTQTQTYNACIYMHIYTYLCKCTHIYTSPYMQTHTYQHIPTHMHTCNHIHEHTNIYMHTHIHRHIHIGTNIHSYMHTYTHLINTLTHTWQFWFQQTLMFIIPPVSNIAKNF